jgi:hypothetical protein
VLEEETVIYYIYERKPSGIAVIYVVMGQN